MTTAAMNQRDRVAELHADFTDRLSELVTSDDWLAAMQVAARFHQYSWHNSMLIMQQTEGRATRVAGYRAWQALGRQVRKGEHGIKILAPLKFKDTSDDGEDRWRLGGFKVVHVFDVSQTIGEPLPEEPGVELLEGEMARFDQRWVEVAGLIEGAGFTVVVGERPGDANGQTNWTTKQVTVDESMPAVQQFKTLVHELAHVSMHGPGCDLSRELKEVEAESVAAIVCAVLGVDSAQYSLPYVAGWSRGDLKIVERTGERARRTAAEILDVLKEA